MQITLPTVTLTLESAQYQRFLDFLTHMFSSITWASLCRYRPSHRPTFPGMARRWWHYAYKQVVLKLQQEPDARSKAAMDSIVYAKSRRNEYIAVYTALQTATVREGRAVDCMEGVCVRG